MLTKLIQKLWAPKPSTPAFWRAPSGLFRLVDSARVQVCFLDQAVPQREAPEDGQEAPAYPRFAWMRGCFDAPQKEDFYIVRYQDEEEFGILAYVDSYQRVFQCHEPQQIPPAKWPDVEFERDVESGYIRLTSEDGVARIAASFSTAEGNYSLGGSWYDFSTHAQGVCREEALSRAYLALVYRPKVLGLKQPLRGITLVDDQLKQFQTLESINRIVREVRNAEEDAAQKPPALLRCFADWAVEAGLASALASERTSQIAQVHLNQSSVNPDFRYLVTDEGCDIPERTIWKIESALNRYFMLREQLGDKAATVELERCREMGNQLSANVMNQAADAETPKDAGLPVMTREWDVRLGIAQGMEALSLPIRFAAEYRYDADEGVVEYELNAPDADMMPDGNLDMMQAYCMRAGVLLAALAFKQSESVERVRVNGSYYYDRTDDAGQPVLAEGVAQRVFRVTFDRSHFADRAEYVTLAKTDPMAFYQKAGVKIGEEDPASIDFEALIQTEGVLEEIHDAVEAVDILTAEKDRTLRTDVLDRRLGMQASMALGCRSTRNMRINYDAAQKYRAQQIADQLKDAPNYQEGVRILRALQEESNDPKVLASCNRVMEQLALGEADMRDSAQIISLFVGDDPFLDALTRSRLISMNPNGSVEEAIAILRKTVDEAEAAGVFADDERMVYRVFDSSTSRVIYNLSREGILHSSGLKVKSDSGKDVELAPDSYLFCVLELVRLLENTFNGVDDAMAYGRIALRLAPTMVVGYRTLARVYMLMGDPKSSRELLHQALRFAVHPTELGYLYYQLGYTEWKAGKLRIAVACYLKAIMEAPHLHAQVSNELRALLGEDGARMMDLAQVLPALRSANVPLAPNDEVLSCLRDAAEQAVNEGLTPAARNMLSLYVHHRPNDALAHVLRSLE